MDDDRDSGSEEMQDSSIGSLLATSEIVSLIFTLTCSAVIVKLANFGDFFIYSTEMLVEAVCCDYERDGIYVAINNKCVSVVCHYCPTKMNLAIHKIKNNLRQNVLFVSSFLCFF